MLIYTENNSNRLEYILDFIFSELSGIEFSVTHSRDEFIAGNGPKINYSNEDFTPALWIRQSQILFENNVVAQTLNIKSFDTFKILFPSNHEGSLPFDVFAASFYLISRYEEYLPHEKDMFGRYAHINSIAFKEEFLQLPLINIWVKFLQKKISERYPGISFDPPVFNFIPTYDIDIAYSITGKGFIRNAGKIAKSALKGNIKTISATAETLLFNKQDPFDIYEELDGLHANHKLAPIYFFLVAAKNSIYDKNILPGNEKQQSLIRSVSEKYRIGLHPSWQSGDNPALLNTEKKQLEDISAQKVNRSRQHYIRFTLPEGYRRLINAGITEDHSMGYGSINGFRASVASPFYWFDLEKNNKTHIRIFPFSYMEANSFYEQKITSKEALTEMIHYYNACKSVDGTFISIWHNHMLGRDPLYEGWKDTYVEFLKAIE